MVEKDRMTAEAKAQKAQERLEAYENAVILYAPGEEPERIRKRMFGLASLCIFLKAAHGLLLRVGGLE